MPRDSSGFRISRSLAWLVIVGAIVAPYLVLQFGGEPPGVVGYEGSEHVLAQIAVVIAAVVLPRLSPNLTRSLTLWGGALICVLLGGWTSYDALQSIAVDREIAAARPMINRLREIAQEENARVGSGSTKAQSPDVHALLEQPPPGAPELSDTSRPLRERLVELTRRESLAAMQLQQQLLSRLQAASDVDSLNYENLADESRRRATLAKLASQRATLDWWIGQVGALSAQYEANIPQLGMPQSSADQMIAGARRSQRDAMPQIKSIVDGGKSVIAAKEEAIRFAGGHERTMHQGSGSIAFDDPQDTATFNALLLRTK